MTSEIDGFKRFAHEWGEFCTGVGQAINTASEDLGDNLTQVAFLAGVQCALELSARHLDVIAQRGFAQLENENQAGRWVADQAALIKTLLETTILVQPMLEGAVSDAHMAQITKVLQDYELEVQRRLAEEKP